MARRPKARKRKAKAELTPKDFRFPGESTVYWTGVGGMYVLFIWVVVMFLAFAKTKSGLPQWQWVYLFLWPICSVLLVNYLSAKPRKADLKKAGPQARVMSSNHPDLFNTLSRQSQLLGLKRTPALYLVADQAAYIFSIPGRPYSIIVSRPSLDAMSREEFAALLAREVGSVAARNVTVGLAIMWIRTANPLLKVAFLPLFLMSIFMRGWADLTELTADRAAVLLVGSEATLNLALVKLVIARDPQADVNQGDLAAFLLGSADEMTADSAQIERHYKIGTFIGEQPNLRERIEQIREYRKSQQGKAAFEKLAEVLAQNPQT